MDQKQRWENRFLTSNSNDSISTDHEWFHSNAILFLFICYAVVIFGGVFVNTTLVCSICSQPSGRLRKPLLFALCLADLSVLCVSAPLTIVILSLAYASWPLQSIGCKAIHYLRSMPVAASTICLLMLSLDRYATVKQSRHFGQFQKRRYLPLLLAIAGWLGACLICIHIFFAYGTTIAIGRDNTTMLVATKQIVRQRGYNSKHTRYQQLTTAIPPMHMVCKADYGSPELHTTFVILHALIVFVIPAVGVLINTLGVRQKLCALSLTARAAHGELPLPMPILRRPTHMIIVTGMPNNAHVGESSDDENGGQTTGRPMTRLKHLPRTPRSIRRAQTQNTSSDKPSGDLPLPQTSTLRSRRRLANILVASALIFACLWAPHVFCFLCIELGAAHVCTKSMSEFSLLLGYAHSAISPIVYWTLNHNSLRQTCCSPCGHLNSAQHALRSHLRFRTPPPPQSSTNVDALGPFNPILIKKTRNNRPPPPPSSHFLY